MGLVGLNNAPLRENAIFAFDGTNYRAVKCDLSGNLIMAVSEETIVFSKECGYVDGDYSLQALALGYSGVINFAETVVSTGAASTSIDGDVVPEGEIWVLENMVAQHADVPTRLLYLFAVDGLAEIRLNWDALKAASSPLTIQTQITLGAGCFIRATCFALATGKSLYFDYWGRKISKVSPWL
jgi:hypothetical protein